MSARYILLASTVLWNMLLARIGLASEITPTGNEQARSNPTAERLANSSDHLVEIQASMQGFSTADESVLHLQPSESDFPLQMLVPTAWNNGSNEADKTDTTPVFSITLLPDLVNSSLSCTPNSSVCSSKHSSSIAQSISIEEDDLAVDEHFLSNNLVPTNINTASVLLPLEQLQTQNIEIDRRLDDPPYPFPDDLEIDESGGQLPLAVIRAVPVLQLQLESAVLTNSDVSATSILEDSAFINSIALQAAPALGSDTRLTAGVGTDLIRFASGNGYNQVATTLGILQELGDNMALRILGGYRQTYGVGRQFKNDLTEYSARLGLSRIDQLEQGLSLYSSNDLQVSFAEAESQSRITNSLRLGLGYNFTPELQAALGYRFIYEDYTESSRITASHQVSAQTSYQFNRDLSLALAVSYLFGDSFDLLRTEERDLNNISVGLYLRYNIPLLF